jgi:SAM-dependent methyltransferase
VKYSADPGSIPFGDGEFDVAIANQVLEHVGDLEALAAEVSRVLKPRGSLFATFPLKTSVIEQHCLSPFAHWFGPGSVRQAWLFLTCPKTARDDRMPELATATGLHKRVLSSRSWDTYLATCCAYRSPSEIREITERHFRHVDTDRDAYGQYMLGRYLRGTVKLPRVASTLFCSLANDAWVFRKA